MGSSEIRLSVLFTLVILITWLFDVKHCKKTKQKTNKNCKRESQTCFQLQDFGRVFSLVSFGAEWKALHKKESESMKSGDFPPQRCGDMALGWLGKSFETQTHVHTNTKTRAHKHVYVKILTGARLSINTTLSFVVMEGIIFYLTGYQTFFTWLSAILWLDVCWLSA